MKKLILITLLCVQIIPCVFAQKSGQNESLSFLKEVNNYLTLSRKGIIDETDFIEKFFDTSFFKNIENKETSVLYLNFRSFLYLYRDFLVEIPDKELKIIHDSLFNENYVFGDSNKQNSGNLIHSWKVLHKNDNPSERYFLLWIDDKRRLRMITASLDMLNSHK